MTCGIFAGRIPFWYITLVSLLYHSVAFLIYAIAMDGWIVIAAQLLSGMFVGQQSVVSLTYIGVSYQHYVEILGPKERIEEEGKITRVKDTLCLLQCFGQHWNCVRIRFDHVHAFDMFVLAFLVCFRERGRVVQLYRIQPFYDCKESQLFCGKLLC